MPRSDERGTSAGVLDKLGPDWIGHMSIAASAMSMTPYSERDAVLKGNARRSS